MSEDMSEDTVQLATNTTAQAMRDLCEVAALARNWDGEDADAPSAVAIGRASLLIELVADTLAVKTGMRIGPGATAPLPDGGVYMEWARGNRRVEVDVCANGKVSYIVVSMNQDQRSYQEYENVPMTKAANHIGEIVAGQ